DDGSGDLDHHAGAAPAAFDVRHRCHKCGVASRSARHPPRRTPSRLTTRPSANSQFVPFRRARVMYARVFSSGLVVVAVTVAVLPAAAQPAEPQHDMQHMHMDEDHAMSGVQSREGSGTSWLPDDTPMFAVHREAGPWTLMAHANVFVQYLRDGS